MSAGDGMPASDGTPAADPATPDAPVPSPAAEAKPAGGSKRSRLGRWWWVVGIAIAVLVVIVLAPRASSDPDGLERIAEDKGFIGQAQNVFSGILGGYAIPGIDDPAVSTILSGLLGLAIVLVIMFLLGRFLARRKA